MNETSNAVIVSTNPTSDRLDVALARYLGGKQGIAQWIYTQSSPDVASSMAEVSYALETYLANFPPVHLIGHSINGMIAFLYAQKFPDRVLSLTLLSVGKNIAMNWVSQYYFNLNFLPVCRKCLLKQMAVNLFGKRSQSELEFYVSLLDKDLSYGFCPHSPMSLICKKAESLSVPLLVCGSQDDFICDPDSLNSWYPLLKTNDRLHLFSGGRHFFHHFQTEQVGEVIKHFWHSRNCSKLSSSTEHSLFN